MKSRLILPIILLVLPFFVRAQKGLVESSLPPNPIVIDADVSEWGSMEWMMDAKGKFVYNICNDADNLYVRIRISDELTQRKVGLYGMTLFLNPSGKKIGKLGVKYPVEKDMEQLARDSPPPGTQLSREQIAQLKNNLVKDVEVLELVGLAKENIVSPRLGLMNGLQVFIKADERGDFIYETKIPFKAFRIDKKSVKVLGVAFVTGHEVVKTKPQNNSPQNGTGGGVYPGGYIPQGYDRTLMRQMYGMNSSSSYQYSVWQSPTSLSVGVTLK